jgi:hypothetical protein
LAPLGAAHSGESRTSAAQQLQTAPPKPKPQKPKVPPPRVPTNPPTDKAPPEEAPAREAPNDKQEPNEGKKGPIKKLAGLVSKKLKKKDSTLNSFEVTMLDNGIAHIRMTGDCGRYPVRKMYFRGHTVKVDKQAADSALPKEKGPRSFIVDTYVPVFRRGDVQSAKNNGLPTVKRELEVSARCQVFKRKNWGRRTEHPTGKIELTLPITSDLDPAQFKP